MMPVIEVSPQYATYWEKRHANDLYLAAVETLIDAGEAVIKGENNVQM